MEISEFDEAYLALFHDGEDLCDAMERWAKEDEESGPVLEGLPW
jgi:hypothetical protein